MAIRTFLDRGLISKIPAHNREKENGAAFFLPQGGGDRLVLAGRPV
jgi:hypothetical protein